MYIRTRTSSMFNRDSITNVDPIDFLSPPLVYGISTGFEATRISSMRQSPILLRSSVTLILRGHPTIARGHAFHPLITKCRWFDSTNIFDINFGESIAWISALIDKI